MTREEAVALQASLLALFESHGLSVGVGLTHEGVAIRSQDKQVDARNLGDLAAWRGGAE